MNQSLQIHSLSEITFDPSPKSGPGKCPFFSILFWQRFREEVTAFREKDMLLYVLNTANTERRGRESRIGVNA